MPQPQRRRLLDDVVKRHNPYTDTIDLAMERLANVEQAIREELPKALQVTAREQQHRRRVFRRGFNAGSDSQGWVYQVPEGRDWKLKRISLVTDATGVYGLFVGSQDAQGLREVMGATQAVTFSNGAGGFAYSDAFSNDLYVHGGDFLYIQFLGGASVNGHTIVASLEAEMYTPVQRTVTEAENYSYQVQPDETIQDEVDGVEVGLGGDRPSLVDHFSPDTMRDMEDDTLYISHTEGPEEEAEVALIPDVSAHLPQHLRTT